MANEILWEHAFTQLPSDYQWQLQPPISQNLMPANFPKPFSGNLLKLDIPSVCLWDSGERKPRYRRRLFIFITPYFKHEQPRTRQRTRAIHAISYVKKTELGFALLGEAWLCLAWHPWLGFAWFGSA
jgi:hypothetical protein